MRIVLHEHFSSRPRGTTPEDLRRAGRAMRDAIAADLRALPGVEVRLLGGIRRPSAALRRTLAQADATLVIAPETDGCLERLAAQVERSGRALGPGPRAVGLAADKLATFRLLRRAGVPTPSTCIVPRGAAGRRWLATRSLPMVLKPRDGCGAAGVSLIRRAADRAPGLARARLAAGRGDLVAQPYVAGIPVGVTFVARAGGGRRDLEGALLLGVSLQRLRGRVAVHYAGGSAPLRGRPAAAAVRAARRAIAALGGSAGDLRGPVGVDLVLTPRGAVVIEINPRLTSSWIGLRRLARTNPARFLLDGAFGRPLPRRAALKGACRFTASGQVRRLARAPVR